MIDSHCHFDLPPFNGKRESILASAQQGGLERLLIPGLTLAQFEKLVSLKKQFACVDIALGCHPYFLKVLSQSALAQEISLMNDLAKRNLSVIAAIGECGLDASLATPIEYQEDVLRAHIRLAQLVDKPLILHHRQSHNALIRVLKQEKFSGAGVLHAFSGSYQIANTYIDLGLALGVGGTITYSRAVKTQETIKAIGMQHILLETDAPDMPLCGFQGMPNTPEQLPLVAQALAQLKSISLEEVVQHTTSNYHRIFTPTHL